MKIECDTYDFAERLTDLRIQKGVSARDMSLSMGQTSSYINNIENKKQFAFNESFFLHMRIFRNYAFGFFLIMMMNLH